MSRQNLASFLRKQKNKKAKKQEKVELANEKILGYTCLRS